MYCGAKTRTGGTCKAPAMENGRCRKHGGKARRGMAVATYKHGKYSQYLPERLRLAYMEAKADPQLLEQREQIAVLDARLIDLLKRVDSGESGQLWQQLLEQRSMFLDAQRSGNLDAQGAAITSILSLIGRGHSDYRAWREVLTVLEGRKRLIESERRRMVEMQQIMTAQQAGVLFSALLEAVRRSVTDEQTFTQIHDEFLRLSAHSTETVIDV